MKEIMDKYFDKMKEDTNIEEFELMCQGPDLSKGQGGSKQLNDSMAENKKNRSRVKSLRPPADLAEKQRELANPKPVRKTNRETSTVNECPRPVLSHPRIETGGESPCRVCSDYWKPGPHHPRI
jgi:hypothetical protein